MEFGSELSAYGVEFSTCHGREIPRSLEIHSMLANDGARALRHYGDPIRQKHRLRDRISNEYEFLIEKIIKKAKFLFIIVRVFTNFETRSIFIITIIKRR